MTESSPPAWGGDPSIAWRILLTATPTTPLTVERLAERQAALHQEQGWPAPPPVVSGDAARCGATWPRSATCRSSWGSPATRS